MYFHTEDDCASHIQESGKHLYCETCACRFPNKQDLQNHWKASDSHHYCLECVVGFKSTEGLELHFEFSPAHCDNGDESDDDDNQYKGTNDMEGWETDFGCYTFPEHEFEAAQRRGELTSYDPEEDEDYDTDDDYFEDDESTLTYHVRPQRSTCSEKTSGSDSLMIEDTPKSSRQPYTCPLCLEIPQHCISTQCGHVFCAPCLGRSLELEGGCPVCNTPVLRKELRWISFPSIAWSTLNEGVESVSTSVYNLYTRGRLSG